MKKYFAIICHCFRIQIVYRAEVIVNTLEIFTRMLFAWLLWSAIFSGQETVGGFTFQAMLFYYILSSFLSSFDLSGAVSGEMSGRIRDGTFSRYMVIPTNTQLHFLAQNIGTSAFYILFTAILSSICMVIFNVNLQFSTDIVKIFCAIIMVFLGLIFMVFLHFFIGILTFKFQDIDFFIRIQGIVLELVTGSIFPLILLPPSIIRTMHFVPFIHVVYTPVMLLMGKISTQNGLSGLAVLISWTAAFAVINRKIFQRLRTKYDGVGI